MEIDVFRTIIPPALGKVQEEAMAAKIAAAPPIASNNQSFECQYYVAISCKSVYFTCSYPILILLEICSVTT